MNKLITLAESYLGVDLTGRKKLVEYYNENCVELVKPARRYEMTMSDNWCAMFTSVIAHKVGLDSSAFPYEVSVMEQYELARKNHSFLDDVSKVAVGDLIMFDWNGNGHSTHVGFISGLSESHIETIEGNYSGTVKSRYVKPRAACIFGFISLPMVDSLGAENERLDALVEGVMLGLFGNGSERVNLLGSDYEEVQRRVNNLMK